MTCIFPGSFDPLTKAHEDVLRRAASIFDNVIFALLCNPSKRPLIPDSLRLQMMEKLASPYSNVKVSSFTGLLAEYAKQEGAQVILRGLRSEAELSHELPYAHINRQLYSNAETLFIPTAPQYSAFSSSAVKEIAMFGGNYQPLLPDCLVEDIRPYLEKQ